MGEARLDTATIQGAARDAQTAILAAGQAGCAYMQAREPALLQLMRGLGWHYADASTGLVMRGDDGRSAPIDMVADDRTAQVSDEISQKQCFTR